MSVYRFPPMANMESQTVQKQLDKIAEELEEASNAYEYETNDQFGVELMDIIHATETLLRMHFTNDEVDRYRAAVVFKNARRAYYEVVD